MEDEIVGRASPVRLGVPEPEVSTPPLEPGDTGPLAAVVAHIGRVA